MSSCPRVTEKEMRGGERGREKKKKGRERQREKRREGEGVGKRKGESKYTCRWYTHTQL